MKHYIIVAALTFYISFYTLLGFAREPNRIDFLMSTKPKTKLVIFSANWCLPCRMIHQWMVEDGTIKDLISKYDVEHYDFDRDKNVRRKYDVNRIPTIIVLKEGVEKARKIGVSSGKKGLESFLETYK